MEAQFSGHCNDNDGDYCMIKLFLTKEDVDYLRDDRRHILEDKYMSRKDEDSTLELLDMIITEAEKGK